MTNEQTGTCDINPVGYTSKAHPPQQAQTAEILRLRAQVAALESRLAYLQQANEASYRNDQALTGGPVLDPGLPFGSELRRLGTLLPASTRVVIWRMGRM
ncbi:hypothetical protein HHL19_16205 [Streptomyces sp. R302]|uniref:hypothetical protein n=1 Tax=unclassified Streptomyces TaxID=2593676 RepID=UPI00145E7C8E|nr:MULTISPECIES: hypothetical protein [unclassified Streptomyces]NML55316.1 hypothetical protein [Streptomyces sp. R301]NML80188.1 hypothetical protein [Streptomyces sp. R302]